MQMIALVTAVNSACVGMLALYMLWTIFKKKVLIERVRESNVLMFLVMLLTASSWISFIAFVSLVFMEYPVWTPIHTH